MKIDIIGGGLTSRCLAFLLKERHDVTIHALAESKHGNVGDVLEKNSYTQTYGPHILHFKNEMLGDLMFNQIVKCVEMKPFYHKVANLSVYGLLPYPANKKTLEKLKSESFHMANHDNLESVMIEALGFTGYTAYVKEYSTKQWGVEPDKISVSPDFLERFTLNEDEKANFFPNQLSMIPTKGYSHWMETLSDGVKVVRHQEMLKLTDLETLKTDTLIITASPDQIIDYKYGQLPYIWTKFEHGLSTSKVKSNVLGYPSICGRTLDVSYHERNYHVFNLNVETKGRYTRITDYSMFPMGINFDIGKNHLSTELVANEDNGSMVRTHPNHHVDSNDTYMKSVSYINDCLKVNNIEYAGRLGTYKYMDMDTCIAEACRIAKDYL